MTTLSATTATNNMNTVLSMPSASFEPKSNDTQNYVTYSVAPRNWYRKAPIKLSAIDWDVNMNELEFE